MQDESVKDMPHGDTDRRAKQSMEAGQGARIWGMAVTLHRRRLRVVQLRRDC